MVDGAALLDVLLANPGKPVALSHDQAVFIARSLARAQAMQVANDRTAAVIAGIGREAA